MLILVLAGCTCKFHLNESHLRSTCKIDYDIHISPLTVDSVRWGVPYKFTFDTTVSYSPKCSKYKPTPEELAIMQREGLKISDCDFKASRKMYFDRSNPNYYWQFRDPLRLTMSEKYDTMPITFQSEKWYRISGLTGYKGSNPVSYIYFYITSEGKWIVKYYDESYLSNLF
jgi:hypothetical protein